MMYVMYLNSIIRGTLRAHKNMMYAMYEDSIMRRTLSE